MIGTSRIPTRVVAPTYINLVLFKKFCNCETHWYKPVAQLRHYAHHNNSAIISTLKRIIAKYQWQCKYEIRNYEHWPVQQCIHKLSIQCSSRPADCVPSWNCRYLRPIYQADQQWDLDHSILVSRFQTVHTLLAFLPWILAKFALPKRQNVDFIRLRKVWKKFTSER